MVTTEKHLCETATGCQGAGDFREWAKQQGYPFCEVYDWTSSAGDWSFIVSKDEETWYPMFQENAYPAGRGFNRTIDESQPMDGTPEEVFEFLAARRLDFLESCVVKATETGEAMTLLRQDDTMIAVETASAIVDFADILEATKVVLDNSSGAPWDNCDGFDHKVEIARHSTERNLSEMQGYCYYNDWREYIVITLLDNEDYGIFDWQRSRGATRQVAREAVAAERKRTLAQLVKWYSNGWQWYGVRCDFDVLGQDFGASIWCIDDDEYARREVVNEIADEVADQLEKAGFTVTDRPNRSDYPDREAKQQRIRHNLNIQNWVE